MSNSVSLQGLFGGLQEEMLAGLNTSKTLGHPTDIGDNSEKRWLKWFNDYLPKRYKAAKATIIDCKGNKSDQIDIVLYDNQYSYLAFNANDILFLPAESVYAVFEVKQNLNKEHMEAAEQKAESVRKLYRTSREIPSAGGILSAKPLHRILSGILTTSSDWNPPFSAPFMKCLSKSLDIQQIDFGCVLEQGTFYYNYEDETLKISNKDDSLVCFFFQLLIELQKIGTVPAIELSKYMKALSFTKKEIK